ncbi:exocyst subunit, partial [Linderina pennispora]
MMDTSSLGKSYDEFQQYHMLLNESLDGIVNEYYGGFNNSILTFSGLHDKIQGASGSVNHVKNNLYKVRRMITEERSSLDQLYTKSNQLGSIVAILDRLEEIKKLPEEIAGYVREKKFLTAVSKLVQDMQFVLDPELNPIDALAGLRQQLEKEKADLLQIIIDELHSHIYLKSPYCERKMGTEGEDDEGSEEAVDGSNTGSGSAKPRKAGRRDGRRAKGATAKGNSANDSGDEDNPEADSFAYVEMLLESLVTLDNTSEAMQEIKSSVSLELSRLIDGIVAEVEERNRALITKTSSSSSQQQQSQEETMGQDTDREILIDFARILFARLETVLEYHDFVLDVMHSMDRRERYSIAASPGTSNGVLGDRSRRTRLYTILDVWSAMKTEILSILKDYLVPVDTQALSNVDITRTSGMRSGMKDLFHMESTDEMASAVESMYAQIESRFQDMTVSIAGKRKDIGLTTVVDEYSDQQNGLQHTMLVPANIDHAPTMLNLALQFTRRIRPMLATALTAAMARRSMLAGDQASPNRMSMQVPGSGSPNKEPEAEEYLHIFFKSVFLPCAEAHAMRKFDAITTSSDAFQVDLNTYWNGRPIFRSAAVLVPLFRSFSRLLNSLNLLRGENWNILLQMSGRFYECCNRLFLETVHNKNSEYTSVKWANSDEFLQLFDRRIKLIGAQNKSQLAVDTDNEIRLEESLRTERSLSIDELIFDVKRLVTLAQLHQTLEWLLMQLTKISEDRAKVLAKNHEKATAAALLKKHEADRAELVDKYHRLSVKCLIVLRIEVRAHCTYYLDLATREGDYASALIANSMEPDTYIQSLNADISTIEEKMESCLPADRLNLVFGGISILMAHTLITNIRHIRHYNESGSRKMTRNILALQQNLTNIALPEEGGLDRALKFYEL